MAQRGRGVRGGGLSGLFELGGESADDERRSAGHDDLLFAGLSVDKLRLERHNCGREH